MWWSGLSVKDAKTALQLIQPNFITEPVGPATYWFSQSFPNSKSIESTTFLLPAFDEFIISYKDRKASLLQEDHKKAISENGIFRPLIVTDGKVVGLWKRALKKEAVVIETNFFQPPDQSTKLFLKKKAEAFGHFLDKHVEIIHN